jgi:glycosyltransferase involved in cell wall biosynthesis
MNNINLSIVIPCFNEEKNIFFLFQKIEKLLENISYIEIIIIDNGSTDGTYQKIINTDLFKKKKINFLSIEKNIGYGHGIMAGVNIAKGNFIGWCHADLQTEPIDVLNAYKKNINELQNENCVIKGLRKNRNIFDSMFTFGMSIFASIIFLKKINDINAQPKLFPKSFLIYFKDYPLDFSLDLYFLVIAKTNNYRIINHEVIMKKRLYGEAKGGGSLKGKIKLIKRTLFYIIELKKKLWNI